MEATKDSEDQARAELDSIIEMMRALETEDMEAEESARECILKSPLSVEVRSDWHSPGNDKPTEYNILLCTGPTVRITGELDEYSQPETAQMEYQDWGISWEHYTDTSSEEDKALLDYAQQFYYGG